MKLILDKKADKVLSIYWFAIILIVAGGVFGMVYFFYGTPYDVREIEANLLTNKIADCISYTGRINSIFISNNESKTPENILKECHLIFNSTEWEEEQYYFEINFYKLEDLNNAILNITHGNKNLITSCEVQEEKKFTNLAQCIEKKLYSLDELNNQYIIKILTSVRKTEKNVKI